MDAFARETEDAGRKAASDRLREDMKYLKEVKSMELNNKDMSLVRLGGAMPKSLNYPIRLRGRVVVGSRGREIGTVTDFYIDCIGLNPQFLQVTLRGMQFEESVVLIPLTIIDTITETSIQLNQPRDQIQTMPRITNGVAQLWFLQWSFSRLEAAAEVNHEGGEKQTVGEAQMTTQSPKNDSGT